MMKQYRVVYRMDDNGWWFVEAPEVPGAHSHGQTIARARTNIKEAIAAILDLPDGAEASMELEQYFDLPPAVESALVEAHTARADFEATKLRLTSVTDTALEILTKEFPDMGLRDLADLVGVSFQRVAQLRPGAPRRGRKAAPSAR